MSMKDCTVCGQPRSSFILNNKTVCMKCDELLFDLEIETDDAPVVPATKRQDRSIGDKPTSPTIGKKQ